MKASHTLFWFIALTSSCAASPSDPCNSGDTRSCTGPGSCEGGQSCDVLGAWGRCECGAQASDEDAVPITDLAALFAAAVCDNIGPCCDWMGVAHDAEDCRNTAQQQLQQFVSTIESGDYAFDYDPKAAADCIEGFRRAALDCVPYECEVTRGKLAPGEPCQSDLECAGSLTEDTQCTEAVPGQGQTCQVFPMSARQSDGEPCAFSCSQRSGSGLCPATAAAPGEASSGTVSGGCYEEDGLYCNPTTATCQPMPIEGESCSLEEGIPCAASSYCGTEGLCTARSDDLGDVCTSDSCARGHCEQPVPAQGTTTPEPGVCDVTAPKIERACSGDF